MALYDTADLLARCKRDVNRPSSDEAATVSTTDDVWYGYLTDAQLKVYRLMAAHCPEPLLTSPTLLTTTDGGLTYTFGTSPAYPSSYQSLVPIGMVEVAASKKGPRLLPGTPWDNVGDTFIYNGGGGTFKISWPGGRSRTFSDGPYARWIAPPGVIDGSTEPSLVPVWTRGLLVHDACARFVEMRLKGDPTPYVERFNQGWMETLAELKNQFYGQGNAALANGPAVWYRASF